MMNKLLLLSASVMWLAGSAPPDVPPVKPPAGKESADKPSEEALIQNIKRLNRPELAGLSDDRPIERQLAAKQLLLAEIDTLLQLYPQTSYRDEALIAKLQTLADLSQAHPGFLQELLSLTDRITKEKPAGRLASENAYYAIQAFVLGARNEGMPEERRLEGTRERYVAFLEDYPTSPHVPVIRASLIRNLIALKRTDEARAVFEKLKHDYPDHKATRRAQGELYRVVALGQPFALAYPTSQGETMRTADFLGKVLVVHFWATKSTRSMDQLADLLELHRRFEEQGLQLVGVNVDKDRKSFDEALRRHKIPWPQYFDGKGIENEMLVATGVVEIPTYFVVDRKGNLRAVGGSENPAPMIEQLLDEK